MLERAGDLGLGDEAFAAERIVGVLLDDLLERDLAVELAIKCQEDDPQPSSRMRPDDAEPLAVGRGRANKVIGGPVGVIVFRQFGR